MKDLKILITEKLYHQQVDEKLVFNKHTREKQISDEELEKDYQEVDTAYTKAEKKVIADKYNCKDIRIRPIQIAILDKFRENRFNKKEFALEDIHHFWRYDPSEAYDKFKLYLEKEPEDFLLYFYNYYVEKCKPLLNKYYKSPSDKRLIKIKNNLKKYLDENGISY